jgi:hypothetical protein
MKKKLNKLSISKETIAHLNENDKTFIDGGAVQPPPKKDPFTTFTIIISNLLC